MASFYRWGSTASRLEPLWGGSLLFTTKVPRNFWYSFYQPRKDDKLSQPWSQPVVLNTRPLDWQGIIQAVLFMSVFEQRLSFQMIYFKKNHHEIIVKCRWGSGGALSSAGSSWRSHELRSRGKDSEKVWSFYILRANK